MNNENGLWSLLQEYHVVIPMIQRDYAQGRNHEKIKKIRKNLLKALFDALSKDQRPLKLDFIYGHTQTFTDPDENQRIEFYPLDGQQRLTTLYLLHWYLAVKENRRAEAESVLEKFQYQTRHSAREFCNRLVKYQPEDLDHSLREHIINQPWFFMDWNNEPTISGMLRMLDAIQMMDQEYDLPPIWDRLTDNNPPIIFYLLPMDQLGLADDLYIKMNARGKELTEFEHFKIKFSQLLQGEQREVFNHKIDKEWSDLFWNLYKEDKSGDLAKKADEGIMRFFAYITDIFDAKYAPLEVEENGEMGIYKRVYQSSETVNQLFDILDQMKKVYHQPDGHSMDFDQYFYIAEKDFTPEKVRFFFLNSQIDLFKKCADRYQPTQRINPFTLGEQLILYACILHFIHKVDDFPVKIRKIRNLISSSEDTLRKENMGRFLNEIESMILNGIEEEDTKFNKSQIREEMQKEAFLMKNPAFKERLYRLEDHRLLQGCLGIFRLDETVDHYGEIFQKVFYSNCDFVKISRALFAHGDYTQKIRSRWLLGGKKDNSWREFFFPSQVKAHYDKTKEVFYKLLDSYSRHEDLDRVITDFLQYYEMNPNAEKPWYYYYIKYDSFIIHQEGYYHWQNKSAQYVCLELRRKQKNGHHWDPFLLAIFQKLKSRLEGSLHIGKYGSPLTLSLPKGTIILTSRNHGFHIKLSEESEQGFIEEAKAVGLLNEDDVFPIKQTPEGMDLEDRVESILELVEFGMGY